jgi:hypothetical protein
MLKPIPLRADYDAAVLRRTAREVEDAGQVRRLLALAVIYDGGSRTQAAAVGGVTLQVVRDCVNRLRMLTHYRLPTETRRVVACVGSPQEPPAHRGVRHEEADPAMGFLWTHRCKSSLR